MDEPSLALHYPAPRSYPAKLDRVVDGDTVVLDIDVGFDLYVKAKCRLARINSPELTTAAGVLAKHELAVMFSKLVNGECKVSVPGRDKYGRWLADIYGDNGGYCLNDLMVEKGHAVYAQY